MKRKLTTIIGLVAATALPGISGDWNQRLAAEYMDSRQQAWSTWKPAAATGGTCFSCHTGMTYLLARPALRRVLGESEPTSYEKSLRSGLLARLDNMKVSPAVGVDSVFGALFLAGEAGADLSPDASRAFERMWTLQMSEGKDKGAWPWFNLDLDPWETTEARFFGATLAALATGNAPASYRERADVQPHIASLLAYLERERPAQPLHNRLMLVWASTKLPGVLSTSARREIIDEILRKQQSDGSWTLASLGAFKKRETAPPSEGGNNYATALAAFVIQRAGVAPSSAGLKRALSWLRAQQDPKSGYWAAESMNKRYEPDSMPLLFMRDAATGFATLALLEAGDSQTAAHTAAR